MDALGGHVGAEALAGILTARRNREKAAAGMLAALLVASAVVAVVLGQAPVGLRDTAAVIAGVFTRNQALLESVAPASRAVIWDIRLPRIASALVVGGGLAVAGAVFQSILANPLADAYTMGVSTGAAFGAAAAIYLSLSPGCPVFGNLSITACAFAGAAAALGAVMAIAQARGYFSAANLVIAGIIVSTILASGVSFLKSAAGENVAAIVGWLIGSLSARNWGHLLLAGPGVVACTAACCARAGSLNILSLGEDEARSLGIDPGRQRRWFLVLGSLITALCVSVSGIIGFVGLVVPHMLRMAIGSDNRALVPLSALLGAELLLVADTASRSLLRVEAPVGVLTTLLGGPFFIYMFVRGSRSVQ